MLMAGCCCWGASEAGAFGFSNERSLVYCAKTLSWGGAASGGEPLPLVIEYLLEGLARSVCRKKRKYLSGRVAIIAPVASTRTTIAEKTALTRPPTARNDTLN